MSGTTKGATPDGFPVNSYCGFGNRISAPLSHGVWFSFQAPSCQGVAIEFNTCHKNTKFDTKLSVFDTTICGTTLDDPDDVLDYCIGGNDDSIDGGLGGMCNNLRSRFLFNPTPSKTYLLYVHGFGTQTGNFELNYMYDCPSTHDTCATAKVLSYSKPVVGSNAPTASTAGEEVPVYIPSDTCGTQIVSPAVWYTWTSGESRGTTSVVLTGSTFDTKISVYTGRCGRLTCMGGSDDSNDANGYYRSTFELKHTQKTQYWLLVHGHSSPAELNNNNNPTKDTGAFSIMLSDTSSSNNNNNNNNNKHNNDDSQREKDREREQEKKDRENNNNNNNNWSKIVLGEREIFVPAYVDIIVEMISLFSDLVFLLIII